MARQKSRDDLAAQRREAVSRLKLKGYSVRQIAVILPTLDPPVLNEQGEPFKFQTIHQDINWLRKLWRERMAENISDHQARLLAEFEQIKHEALTQVQDRKDSLTVAMQALDRVAKLLGLNAPDRIEQTGSAAPTIVRKIVHVQKGQPEPQEGEADADPS